MRSVIASGLLLTALAIPAAAQTPAIRAARAPAIRAAQQQADPARRGPESIFSPGELPSLRDGKMELPPLRAPTTDVTGIGTGVVPEGFASRADAPAMPLPEGVDRPEPWVPLVYHWQPPGTIACPNYFEDIMLERHGHQRFPVLQPLVSGARFFGTLPALPYLMTLQPPGSHQYQLGYWNPGSRAPRLLQRPPFQMEAVTVQAIAVSSGVLAIP